MPAFGPHTRVEPPASSPARGPSLVLVFALSLIGFIGVGSMALVATAVIHSRSHYTCADILGTPPRPGHWAVIPPHWRVSAGATIVLSRDGTAIEQRADYRVWNETGKLVCDAEGKDVR